MIESDVIPLLHPDHKAYVARVHRRVTDKQVMLILSHTTKELKQDYLIVELPSEIPSREHFITETFANIESVIVNLGVSYE